MQAHQFFDLQILTNKEIGDILDQPITERETLAQWPLSCVEKITCENGSSWIVKANHEPCDIEGRFYAKINHPNVIKPVHIQTTCPYQNIIYRYIEGFSYDVVNLNKKRDAITCFRDDFQPLLSSINQPNLPVYLKIDTKEEFLTNFDILPNRLTRLVNTGTFDLITKDEIGLLSRIIVSDLTIEIAIKNTSLVHGDFTIDNILFDMDKNSLIILDWQRPIYGSQLIDEYAFVKSRGFDPDPPAQLIGSLVQIYWLVDCAVNWFPEGSNTYDRQTRELVSALVNAYHLLKANQIKM